MFRRHHQAKTIESTPGFGAHPGRPAAAREPLQLILEIEPRGVVGFGNQDGTREAHAMGGEEAHPAAMDPIRTRARETN